jgi:hypothetical protein
MTAPEHDAAVQYTPELPVKIIMSRTATGITSKVNAEREGIAPKSR